MHGPRGRVEAVARHGANPRPSHLAQHTPYNEQAYQHLGRCFVDLGVGEDGNPIYLPTNGDAAWKVTLLSTRQLVPAVDLYSKLELKLATLEGMTLTAAIGHLAQFCRSTYTGTTQEYPAAISLLMKSKLGVDARLNGIYEFFKLAEAPPSFPLDKKFVEIIPPHNVDAQNVVA